MAHESVRAALDEFMVFLDAGHCAPVRAQDPPRPNREPESAGGENQPDVYPRRTRRQQRLFEVLRELPPPKPPDENRRQHDQSPERTSLCRGRLVASRGDEPEQKPPAPERPEQVIHHMHGMIMLQNATQAA